MPHLFECVHSCLMISCFVSRYIDMAESLCQKRALEAFGLDPSKWGGIMCIILDSYII